MPHGLFDLQKDKKQMKKKKGFGLIIPSHPYASVNGVEVLKLWAKKIIPASVAAKFYLLTEDPAILNLFDEKKELLINIIPGDWPFDMKVAAIIIMDGGVLLGSKGEKMVGNFLDGLSPEQEVKAVTNLSKLLAISSLLLDLDDYDCPKTPARYQKP